jgi:hypothetical protein
MLPALQVKALQLDCVVNQALTRACRGGAPVPAGMGVWLGERQRS